MVTFEATTTSQSERLLANILGYPKSWHVVRVVNKKEEGSTSTFYDTIYAGDPNANSDTYYNHLAAMTAATKWIEGESTPYDNNGGQMLPIDQTVEIEAGDEVEVYYEPDSSWYAAVVKKVAHYEDDVRYTVKYKVDRSTQDNVCLDKIRFIKAGKRRKKTTGGGKRKAAKEEGPTVAAIEVKGKGKAKKTAVKGKAKKDAVTATDATTPKSTKKRKGAKAEKETPKSKKKKTSTTKKKSSGLYIPDAAGLHLAAEMGLPEGWTASARSKSRFVFINPDGTERFTSKKAVFAHLGEDPPPPATSKGGSSDEEMIPDDGHGDEDQKDVTSQLEAVPIEGEDPPWRTDGHEFLQNRVKYEVNKGEFIMGTVTGWISEKDVDKEGNPGFLSEQDGKPADLFHVTFDTNSAIASQDLEKFELVDRKSVV